MSFCCPTIKKAISNGICVLSQPRGCLAETSPLGGLRRRGGEVKKRRLCKERGLMRLKKKYHFHGKGSFKITVENEAMSGEVMKIQVIPRFSIGLTMYASGGRVNFPASPTLRVCVESHHQFGLTDPPCLKEMWLSFFFFLILFLVQERKKPSLS